VDRSVYCAHRNPDTARNVRLRKGHVKWIGLSVPVLDHVRARQDAGFRDYYTGAEDGLVGGTTMDGGRP
jgi:hypothetical protein